MHMKWSYFLIHVLIWYMVAGCLANGQALATETATEDDKYTIQSTNHALILALQGDVQYKRRGWNNIQPILAGTLISPGDLIYSEGTSISLLILCPDGRVIELLASDLLLTDIVDCRPQSSFYIFGESGSKRFILQRGGKQSPAIPYLIYPRATLVRNLQVSIEWNLVSNASYYIVTLFGDKEPIVSPQLPTKDLANRVTGYWTAPITLEQGIAYSIEICVYYINTQRTCTTDPAWNTDGIAFYYDPAPFVNELDAEIQSNFSTHDVPEELFARAYALSQPNLQTPYGKISFYGEAIKLINEIFTKFPDSQLAKSSTLYNFLGQLYLNIGLPTSANSAFQKAFDLSVPNQEQHAIALLGLANTSSAQNSMNLYQQALDEFETFQNDEMFLQELHQVCANIGSACLTFSQCQNYQTECTAWSQEEK